MQLLQRIVIKIKKISKHSKGKKHVVIEIKGSNGLKFVEKSEIKYSL